jgi:hypothetical protein|tara:strand:- start:237 stop:413 length:177 start_codon:yes stop_codon:yes gene_type:complete
LIVVFQETTLQEKVNITHGEAVMSEVKTSTVLVGAVTALVFGAFVVSIGLYLIDVGLR